MQEKNLEIYLKELGKGYKALLSPFTINSFSLNSSLEVKEVSLKSKGYFGDIDDESEINYFPPYYSDGKLYHFYPTDALMTFLWCGYEIVKIKHWKRAFYTKLAYQDERIYLFTRPDSFIIRFINVNDEKNVREIKVRGFSTIAFYKLSRSKKLKILDLPEINDIFISCMKEYSSYLSNRLFSEDYNVYIF